MTCEPAYSLENYRETVQACYKYFSLLRDSEFPSWIQSEIQALAALKFRFMEKQRDPENYAAQVSMSLKRPLPRSLIVSGPKLVFDWDEQLVRDTLAGLIAEDSRVVLMAKDHSLVGKTGPWSTEPWYGTEYTVDRLETDIISTVSAHPIFECLSPESNGSNQGTGAKRYT